MVFKVFSNAVNGRLTGLTVKDAAGATVAGPLTVATDGTATTTSPIVFPAGVNQYMVYGNPESGFEDGSLLHVEITAPAVNVVAKGATSQSAATVSPSLGIAMDTVTFRQAKVIISTTGPDARTVTTGSKGVNFLELKIDAKNATEDMKLVRVNLVHATSAANIQSNITSLSIYADSTLAPPGIQPTPLPATTAVETIKFTTPVTIGKGQTKSLSVVADVVGLPGQTHSYSCVNESCLELTGVSTGYAISATFVSGLGKTMTVQ